QLAGRALDSRRIGDVLDGERAEGGDRRRGERTRADDGHALARGNAAREELEPGACAEDPGQVAVSEGRNGSVAARRDDDRARAQPREAALARDERAQATRAVVGLAVHAEHGRGAPELDARGARSVDERAPIVGIEPRERSAERLAFI